ncbi:MAG: DUF4080 domain-containing protein, partial [bacterium]|nr:DUF4080 domain-containing protein [bacterium]
ALLNALRNGSSTILTHVASRSNLNMELATIKDLSLLPDPYLGEGIISHKLYYFETSRGCPYNCTYCLSSASSGVRYVPLALAKERLLILATRAHIIKFVDRTFNANQKRARELWQYLLDLPGNCRFHFEICAHLLSEEDIIILSSPKAERFQFEIGLQTTSIEALSAINRPLGNEKVLQNVERLRQETPVELHLDLISGLPHETYERFLQTFDQALSVKPHRLHLGFLKLLRGTTLRAKAQEYEYKFLPFAPYEVLASKWVTVQEFLLLKDIEDAVEKLYNSGSVQRTIDYLLKNYPPSVVFTKAVSADRGDSTYHYAFNLAISLGADANLVTELLRFDFLMREINRALPDWLMWDSSLGTEAEALRQIIYGDKDELFRYLPHRAGEKPGSILRTIRLGYFPPQAIEELGYPPSVQTILFDHTLSDSRRAIACNQ